MQSSRILDFHLQRVADDAIRRAVLNNAHYTFRAAPLAASHRAAVALAASGVRPEEGSTPIVSQAVAASPSCRGREDRIPCRGISGERCCDNVKECRSLSISTIARRLTGMRPDGTTTRVRRRERRSGKEACPCSHRPCPGSASSSRSITVSSLRTICARALIAVADRWDESEVILVDNGSTDGTAAFLATLGAPFRAVSNRARISASRMPAIRGRPPRGASISFS